MSDDQQDAGSTSAAPAAAHQQQQQLPRPVPSASASASASAAWTAAAQPRRSSNDGSSSSSNNNNNNNNDNNSSSGASSNNSSTTTTTSSDDEDSPSQQRTRRHRQALAKKLEYITHLQKSLDMLVVAYICVLYSMETSILRLLLRLLPHFSFLTPKDSLLPPPLLFPTAAAADQGPVYTMFTPTLLCVLTHLFFSLPQAGEASRGYLHGGVIIDFIGQRPPRSRLAFLLLDLVILGLQCLMLAVKRERDGLRRLVLPSLGTARSGSGSGSSNTGEQTGTASTTQDHDAEERGVRRDEEDGGIEMQPLSAADVGGRGRRGGGGGGDDGDDNNNDDDDGGDDGTYASAAASADPLDLIRSGNAVLANFHVAHAVRMGSAVAGAAGAAGAASSPLQTVRYGATLAARAAQRRARLMRTRQQR